MDQRGHHTQDPLSNLLSNLDPLEFDSKIDSKVDSKIDGRASKAAAEAAQEQARTAWLDATRFGHSAHFVGCALRSAGRFTSLTGASRLVTYGAKPRPPQKSGYVHALLTTCLGIRFTTAQIGWTPPGFYGGLGSASLTRGLRPHLLTVLGHLNCWGSFTQAAPPKYKKTITR
jgi:hypothetical protein